MIHSCFDLKYDHENMIGKSMTLYTSVKILGEINNPIQRYINCITVIPWAMKGKVILLKSLQSRAQERCSFYSFC